ncbi:MAG: 30S ribosomal protein S20 [Pirellulaceae bacterium]
MPNTASAKKRLRQNTVRRLRNRTVKSAIRSKLRQVREAISAGDVEKAESEYIEVAKKLDQAGHRNIIHRNKAGRTKSRLQRMIKAAKQSG